LLGLSRATLTLAGVGFALLAAVAWACYILLSAQAGRRWPGISGIAIASVVGAIALAPPAILEAGSVMLDSTVLALGVAVGLLSSVIPYSFELIALRRIPPRVFSILMSLEPAAAAFAAMIVLGEFLSFVQWLAMACVVIASIGATRTSSTLDQPAPD
jgi:inner membrane transporter RhtA